MMVLRANLHWIVTKILRYLRKRTNEASRRHTALTQTHDSGRINNDAGALSGHFYVTSLKNLW